MILEDCKKIMRPVMRYFKIPELDKLVLEGKDWVATVVFDEMDLTFADQLPTSAQEQSSQVSMAIPATVCGEIFVDGFQLGFCQVIYN